MNPAPNVILTDALDPVKLLRIYKNVDPQSRIPFYPNLAPDERAKLFYDLIQHPIQNVRINPNRWDYLYLVWKFMGEYRLAGGSLGGEAFNIYLAVGWLNFAEKKSRTLIFNSVAAEQRFRFLNLNAIRYSMLFMADYQLIPNWWNLNISEKHETIRRSIIRRMGIIQRIPIPRLMHRNQNEEEEEEEEEELALEADSEAEEDLTEEYSEEEDEEYPNYDDDDDEMESSSSSTTTTRTRNPKRKTMGARIRFAGKMYSASNLRNEITKLEHINTFLDLKLNKLRTTQAELN